MISEHDRLFLIGQINPDDRVIHRHQLPQSSQLGIAAPITTRQTTTLDHDVLLTVLGHQALRQHQEDLSFTPINTRISHNALTTPKSFAVVYVSRLIVAE